jgi:hypothetical protein
MSSTFSDGCKAVHTSAECVGDHYDLSEPIETEVVVRLWQCWEKFEHCYIILLSEVMLEVSEIKPCGFTVEMRREECVSHVGRQLGSISSRCYRYAACIRFDIGQ